MPQALDLSREESIAIHAMLLLVGTCGQGRSSVDMASRLGVSSRRLSRVLQRLEDAGFVTSDGCAGDGLVLTSSGESATLLQILESMGGPVTLQEGRFGIELLPGPAHSRLEDLLDSARQRVHDILAATRLSDLHQAE